MVFWVVAGRDTLSMDLDTGFEIGGDGVDLRIGDADGDPSSSRLMILPLLKIILIENAANAKNATM